MKGFLINFLKKNKRTLSYSLLSLCLFLLVGIAIFDVFLRYYNFEKKIKELTLSVSQTEYPVFKQPISPSISARAVVIMDDESKVVLFSKNPNLLFSMASTTKIMTALVGLDYYKADDILTVVTERVEGVNVGFKIGEQLNFLNILYAMLLPSGNDAALVVAQNYPGGEKSFVEKMNEKAQALRLDSTNFADPIGLDDSQDYTTPIDLARLASFALKNPTFAKIVSTQATEITDITGESKYLLNNLNKLLGINGVNGVKTGYTTEAGQVLVTSKVEVDEKGRSHNLIIVVMGSLDRFLDTSKLLYAISENINYLSIRP